MSYLDDILGAENDCKTLESFDTMKKLLKDLNIPVTEAKLIPPLSNQYLYA